jgi:hypothetical protein
VPFTSWDILETIYKHYSQERFDYNTHFSEIWVSGVNTYVVRVETCCNNSTCEVVYKELVEADEEDSSSEYGEDNIEDNTEDDIENDTEDEPEDELEDDTEGDNFDPVYQYIEEESEEESEDFLVCEWEPSDQMDSNRPLRIRNRMNFSQKHGTEDGNMSMKTVLEAPINKTKCTWHNGKFTFQQPGDLLSSGIKPIQIGNSLVYDSIGKGGFISNEYFIYHGQGSSEIGIAKLTNGLWEEDLDLGYQWYTTWAGPIYSKFLFCAIWRRIASHEVYLLPNENYRYDTILKLDFAKGERLMSEIPVSTFAKMMKYMRRVDENRDKTQAL